MSNPADTAIDVVLIAARLVARGTHVLTFARPDHGPLPPVEAGAHIGIHLPNGLTRQYSLIAPNDAPTEYSVGVKLDPASRGGSRYLHEQARLGDRFSIDPPRNNFPLDETAPHTVLIAGGIGITPIHAMLRRLQTLGLDHSLVYACRSREDAALLSDLDGVSNLHLHFDVESDGAPVDLARIIDAAPQDAHLYCCGPTPMLAAFEAAMAASGRPADRGHVEYFTQKHEASLDGGYVVQLAKSGREVAVQSGVSILHALRDLGIEVPSSCEEGVCGSCETRVVSGTPDHRDAILTEDERQRGDTMMICCSGSKDARLVLDL